MTVAESINNAVSQGDITGLRIMMKNSLLVDPSFCEFSEMERLTRDVRGLYDDHDGREFKEDQSVWDDSYMNQLMVQVVGNFSHERVEHLKKVVRYLRPIVDRPQQAAQSNREALTYQEQKRQDERDGRIVHNRGTKIASGAVAGGAVGGTIAAIAGWPVLVGVAAGAAVVGIAVAVVANEG